MSEDLKAFLEVTLPKVKDSKKSKVKIGVSEPKIGAAILEVTAICFVIVNIPSPQL